MALIYIFLWFALALLKDGFCPVPCLTNRKVRSLRESYLVTLPSVRITEFKMVIFEHMLVLLTGLSNLENVIIFDRPEAAAM